MGARTLCLDGGQTHLRSQTLLSGLAATDIRTIAKYKMHTGNFHDVFCSTEKSQA